MTTARLPDPARSRAVLIGVGRYADPGLPPLPAVHNNLTDLRDLLTSEHGAGLPAEHCSVLADPPDAATVAESLVAAADQAQDLLLVYYAGHGLPWTSSNELYLAMGNTRTSIVGSSALRCAEVRQTFLDSTASTRVLIVDCCFSGRAIEQLMADPADVLLGKVDVKGAFVLTATQPNQLAQAPLGQRNTTFTGELVRMLHDGIPAGPELITLDTLYHHLKASLRRRNLPEPTSNAHGSAANLALARNVAHRATRSADIAQLRGQLADLEELQREYPRRLAVLRSAIDELAGAEARAKDVYRSVLGRITEPGIDPSGELAADLAGLAGVDQLAYNGMWKRLADELTAVNRQVAARTRLSINPPAGDALPHTLSPVSGEDPADIVLLDLPDTGPAHGELVGDRYLITGRPANGRPGRLYLAQDTQLPDGEPVVLRHLVTGDRTTVTQTTHERRFLTALDHPNLVAVRGLVQYETSRADSTVGYLVEDYLAGRTLDEIARGSLLPLPMVLGYAHEILGALQYLHDKGLAGCGLTSKDVMQVGDQVKLIGLDGLRRTEDPPPAATELPTLARLLALLRFGRPDVPMSEDEESFRRLLRRAAHPEPAQAFLSAAEMREQVRGVLTEVMSAADGRARPTVSALFSPERAAFGPTTDEDTVDWSALPRSLPAPRTDPADVAAGYLSSLTTTEPAELVRALSQAPVRSPAVSLAMVDVHLTAGDPGQAHASLAALPPEHQRTWRARWYGGLLAIAENRPTAAYSAFAAVYDRLPGELAPQLALAACAELQGHDTRAGTLYQRVWQTDTGFVSAAFGLARTLRRSGRRADVVAALEKVPHTSNEHTRAQVAAIRARLDPRRLAKADLLDATARLEQLQGDLEHQTRLSIDILSAKLTWVRTTNQDDQDPEFDERTVRRELEAAYRDLARIVRDADERSALVDHANRVRPPSII